MVVMQVHVGPHPGKTLGTILLTSEYLKPPLFFRVAPIIAPFVDQT
jgi:hypothetical protein